MPKTKEEVEELKRNWKHDPNWDIEDTEGFEDYREELVKFREENETGWAMARRREYDRCAAKLCPMKFNASGDKSIFAEPTCSVENCAWWNGHTGECGIITPGIQAGILAIRAERGK